MLKEGADKVALLCVLEEGQVSHLGMENEENSKFKEPLPHHMKGDKAPFLNAHLGETRAKGFFSSEWKEWRKTRTGTRTKLGDIKE